MSLPQRPAAIDWVASMAGTHVSSPQSPYVGVPPLRAAGFAELLGTSSVSAAPVSVSDSGGRAHVEAHDGSLGQILAALQESHLIEFSASEPLSRIVTGTYTGTLSQVLPSFGDWRL